MTGMGYLGFAMFNTVIWAVIWAPIIEVVDDSEVTTDNCRDGAVLLFSHLHVKQAKPSLDLFWGKL